jgi:hypothetical protein
MGLIYSDGIRALSLGTKRSDREPVHSPPSFAELNNAWSYNDLHTPICVHGVVFN